MTERAGAYWFIDEIAFQQIHLLVSKEEFQVWTLRVDQQQSTAILTSDDGNRRIVFTKNIGYTRLFIAFWIMMNQAVKRCKG